MTKEERRLLLNDLFARLPYLLYVQAENKPFPIPLTYSAAYFENYFNSIPSGTVKPYLRPMSSMTEKEKEDMHNILSPEGTAIYENEGIATPCNHHGEWIPYEFMARIVDWLNAHHFDYRGLIEKGLVLEAPEGMYN